MNPFVERRRLETRVRDLSDRYPVTAVLGARQTGKTSLCRDLASSPDHYFDLERTFDAVRLSDNGLTVLGGLSGWIVIDEAQELPDLFKTLRVLADRPERPARFILTGSVAPSLMRSISESLAGRVGIVEIGGFSLSEVGAENWENLWLRGGYPPAFLSPNENEAFEWREFMLDQMIGKDIRRWSGTELHPAQLRKLLELVADSTGRSWNHSFAAKVLGISYKTVQSCIEVLKGAYLLRELPPMEANVRKRLKKSPTLLFRDTGNLHNFLRVAESSHLMGHPRKGFSWEAFGIDQVVRMAEFREHECYRYSVQGGAEIDLVADLPGHRIGFEFKSGDATKVTSSMRAGREDLGLHRVFLVCPGKMRSILDEGIEIVGIERLPELCEEIRSRR